MNILFISVVHISRVRGGVERVTETMSKELLSNGYKVYMISLKKAIEGDRVYPYQSFLPSEKTISDANMSYIRDFVSEHRIDIILNQSDTMEMMSLIRNSCQHIPIISFYHNDPNALKKGLQDNWDLWKQYEGNIGFCIKFPYYFLRHLYQCYTRRVHAKKKLFDLYQKSTALVLLSDRFKKPFIKASGIKDSAKLYAINNPLSFESDKKKDVSKERIVLFIGRLEYEQKRPDRMIEVWDKIGKKTEGWKLVIAGEGSLKKELESRCNKKGLKNVQFCGITDPQELYEKSEILCMTSTFEGFPMVLVEALEHKVIPIVFDSCESIKDIMKNDTSGFFIKPFSTKKYCEKLALLMENEQLRENMRNNITNSSIAETLSSKNIAQRWFELFNKIFETRIQTKKE